MSAAIEIVETEQHPSALEAWITSFGATFRHRTVAVDLIDTKKSRHNQARFVPIDDEYADVLSLAVKNGAVFPPLVCYALRSGLVLVDGNHRHEALLRCGIHRCDVIEVDAEPETLRLMTESANETNGVRNKDDERRLHIVQGSRRGIAHGELARRFNVSTHLVSKFVRVATAMDRMVRLGVEKEARKLTESRLIQIGVIRSDDALVRLVRFVDEHPQTNDLLVKAAIKAAQDNAGSDLRALAAMEAVLEEGVRAAKQASIVGGAKAPSRNAMLRAHLTYIANVDLVEVEKLVRDDPTLVPQLLKLTESTLAQCEGIYNVLRAV